MHSQVSRTLYALALELYPSKEHIWKPAAQLEMTHGTLEQVWESQLRAAERQ